MWTVNYEMAVSDHELQNSCFRDSAGRLSLEKSCFLGGCPLEAEPPKDIKLWQLYAIAYFCDKFIAFRREPRGLCRRKGLLRNFKKMMRLKLPV